MVESITATKPWNIGESKSANTYTNVKSDQDNIFVLNFFNLQLAV